MSDTFLSSIDPKDWLNIIEAWTLLPLCISLWRTGRFYTFIQLASRACNPSIYHQQKELAALLGLAACSEGRKNKDYESMTPEMVIAKRNS